MKRLYLELAILAAIAVAVALWLTMPRTVPIEEGQTWKRTSNDAWLPPRVKIDGLDHGVEGGMVRYTGLDEPARSHGQMAAETLRRKFTREE